MKYPRYARTVLPFCLALLWAVAPGAFAKDAPSAKQGFPKESAERIRAQVQPYVDSGDLMGLVVGVITREGTLRHLSTHTSGLPRMPSNFHPKNPRNPYVDYTTEQLHAALKNRRRRKTPGTAYAYSNLAVGLLGEVLSNTAAGLIDDLGNRIGLILAGKTIAPPEVQKPVLVDAKVLATYVGRYELTPTFILTITVEAGTLFVQATGQPRLRTRAKSNTAFVNDAAKAEIVFERDDAGKTTRLVLHQGGREQPAKRL